MPAFIAPSGFFLTVYVISFVLLYYSCWKWECHKPCVPSATTNSVSLGVHWPSSQKAPSLNLILVFLKLFENGQVFSFVCRWRYAHNSFTSSVVQSKNFPPLENSQKYCLLSGFAFREECNTILTFPPSHFVQDSCQKTESVFFKIAPFFILLATSSSFKLFLNFCQKNLTIEVKMSFLEIKSFDAFFNNS